MIRCVKNFLKKILKIILPSRAYYAVRKKYWKLRKARPFAKAKKKIGRFILLAVVYPCVYYFCSRRPVQDNKVIFVEVRMDGISNNLSLLHRELEGRGLEIHDHFLHSGFWSPMKYAKACFDYVVDIATAKYIFITDSINILGRIHLRKETKMIQTWHGCGAFKKFGYSTCDLIFGPGRKNMDFYPTSKNYTFVTVSSPEVIWAFEEALEISRERICSLGISRTDVLFDSDFRSKARKRLELLVPQAKEKKIIMFSPTFRGRVAKATTSMAFSIPMFYQELSDEYILIIKHHPIVKKVPSIPKEYREFAFDLSKIMDIEELLCVADICISDYSSLIYEYSLFEKPMIFFAYDLEDYFDWRGFYYNYDEMTPGPICRTNGEMIDYIKHIDERFDKQKVIEFKNKFMSSCDGHSTERILEKALGDDLRKYAKLNKEDVTSTSSDTLNMPLLIPDPKEMDVERNERLKEKLLGLFPALKGKKVIAYIMTRRSHFGFPGKENHVDWKTLYEKLSHEYVILYRHPDCLDKRYLPPNYLKTFFYDCTKITDDQSLIQLADIVITDYGYNQIQYSCLGKKTLIFIPDYKKVCSSVDEYIQLTEWFVENGLFVEDTLALIAAIQKEMSDIIDRRKYLESYYVLCHRAGVKIILPESL